MRPRTSHIILVAAAVLLTLLLAGEAVDPVLYAAENISTAAHADPSTIEKRSPGDAASVVPLMDELLGHTGTLALRGITDAASPGERFSMVEGSAWAAVEIFSAA